DVNDTVLQADPKDDIDVGGFFERIPDSDYLPSWYENRINGQKGAAEKLAAEKAADHNGTPTAAHFDSLGQPFLTVADNGQKGTYETRVDLDIEGNQRAVIDAKDRIVMQYDYTMVGPEQDENGEPTNTNLIHQGSMETGERWILNDVAGKPIYGWDSRGHQTRNTYDELQRPTGLYVSANGNPEVLAEKTVYGETLPNPEQSNHRGRVYQVYDGSGMAASIEYDFKGNLLRGQRQLLQDYKSQVDWTQSPSLESEIFTGSTRFDALNRAAQIIAPHSDQGSDNINIIQPTYNEANFIECVDAWLNQSAEPQVFLDPAAANLHAVENIDYDAKGQRTRIEYGNKVFTTYEYDPDTFRLIHLKTTGANGGNVLQDLHYVYDPAGNITSIRDDAQQTVYFNNQVVESHAAYRYDAIYRLEEATGREHIGQVSKPATTWNDKDRTDLGHPNDGQQMRIYTENYEYDEVGNILNLIHQANNNGNWTRTYNYNEPNLIDPLKNNNRLSATTVGSITVQYEHDGHGSMTKMPHLPVMEWDFEDQLHVTQRQVVNNGNTAERTYYVYDAAGERVRKVTERQNGTRKDERLYLGGFEIYRDYNGNGTTELERETLHIMDDTRRIALVETRTQGDDGSSPQLVRYQFGNHLGSVSLELDDGGEIISYEEYYPYGSTSYQAVDKNIKAAARRYRYTGKERDEESGLYYHGARYYAPWLTRWVSCDPAGMADGPNLYRYSRGNPLSYTDPTGRQSMEDRTREVRDILREFKKLDESITETEDALENLQKRLNRHKSFRKSSVPLDKRSLENMITKEKRDIKKAAAALRKLRGEAGALAKRASGIKGSILSGTPHRGDLPLGRQAEDVLKKPIEKLEKHAKKLTVLDKAKNLVKKKPPSRPGGASPGAKNISKKLGKGILRKAGPVSTGVELVTAPTPADTHQVLFDLATWPLQIGFWTYAALEAYGNRPHQEDIPEVIQKQFEEEQVAEAERLRHGPEGGGSGSRAY
ncbi:MAG: hypothetical protein GY801_37045, partial [bacterium]|nr:hypothetical protein [bacterium]